LSPGYVRGLASLQDKVAPFDSAIAKQILEEEWGQSLNSVLSKISDEPVAAASLGQVFKATMKDGREIAVKVQRPNIMNQIALDMHLLREFAPIAKRTFNLNTDTVGTVDAWGAGFIDELDYIQEAENGKYFMKRIQDTSLKDVVFAPVVVDELTTPKVLVTEWIDGERLDKSSNEDVTILCSICMNTYLTMLLELGVLHCDPHPGNLLRTPEGKLCILDWGMVTRLPPELQLTLIEHMAHLTSADYAEVPRDLLLLGFIPEDKADDIKDSGVVEVLSDIYGAWSSGGGVAAINVNQVINQLQELQAKKGNLFQIPPYFAYIAKSFSVLEGIGLSNDPKYSIINECLPYISNRLLTDRDGMGPALSTFVFGPDKANVNTRIVDYKRVEQLVTGFGNFTTSASGSLIGKANLSRTQVLEEAADQVLDIVVTDEETPFQDILLEQLAKIAAASTRSIWTQVRERSGTLPSGRTVLGTIVDPLGLFRTSSLVNACDRDEQTVETTRKLIGLVRNQLSATNGGVDLSDLKREEVIELSAILGRKIWERRVGLLRTGNRFATKLLELTAVRLETGERVSRPSRQPEQVLEPDTDKASASSGGQPPAPSNRLNAARNRLEELQQLDDLVEL
jgi:predicted unusual protein kinase regulating ubiquinone biosynthesis (AarF/ABC1/UbiB family)